MSHTLRAIARLLAAQPWNRPGTDKTAVVQAIEEYARFRAEVARAKRVER